MKLKTASERLGWSWKYVRNILNRFESDQACLEYLINPPVSTPTARKIAQYSILDDKLIQIWPSAAEAARTLAISKSGICNCLHGKSKKSGGFKWKYA